MPVASVLYTTLPMEIWYCTVVYMKMKKPKATQKETINKYSSSYLVGKGCPSMLIAQELQSHMQICSAITHLS